MFTYIHAPAMQINCKGKAGDIFFEILQDSNMVFIKTLITENDNDKSLETQ